jgi:peptidoglycan/xylan/chitin deacetylase (PgdA/CDA1 family)
VFNRGRLNSSKLPQASAHKIFFGILLLTLALYGTTSADPDPAASDQPLGPTKVAITIDDLPSGTGYFLPLMSRAEALERILAALKANGVTAPYGFSNGTFMEQDPTERSLLKMWLEAKLPLGNHTYHHFDLDKVGVQAFLNDIAKEDQLLASLEPSVARRRVFRYPFLSEGSTLERREAVRKYLAQNGYRIAEVTTDYFDWAWNDAYDRCASQHDEKSIQWLKDHVTETADRQLRSVNSVSERLLRHRIPQIVLIHLNVFTAITLGNVLQQWKKEGVQFIALDEATREPIFRFDPKFTSSGGRDFLTQIAGALGGIPPDYKDHNSTLARLDDVCKRPAASPH